MMKSTFLGLSYAAAALRVLEIATVKLNRKRSFSVAISTEFEKEIHTDSCHEICE